MDRPRHEALIAKIRKAGAAVKLITDGDVAGVIETTDPATGVDIYIGQGGAPEGVLAAAALRCVGGQMQGRLVFRNDDEKAPRRQMGHQGSEPQIRAASTWCRAMWCSPPPASPTARCCAACTAMAIIITTESVVMRSATGTVRWIRARHRPPIV